MHIAYICTDPGVPVFSQKGSSIHVQEVIRAMVGQCAQVELFAARLGGDPPQDLRDIVVHSLPFAPRGDLVRREQAAFEANKDLNEALKIAGPFDLVYERYALWGFAGMEYARSAHIPGLLEVNAPLVEEQVQYRGLVDRLGAESVSERVFKAATMLIAVSDEIAAYLESFPEVRGRVHIVPNGVNPLRFPAGLAPACPARPGTYTVGFVGSLKPWHGLPVLVEAFALLLQRAPACRLLIVGDGPERDNLAAHISSQGISQAVHLTGALSPGQVPGMLASMDVGVAPYSRTEQFYFSPLKVYEYMAAGLPVSASKVGQLASLIHEGVNGLLSSPGDVSALAEVLDRLRLSPQLRHRLGQAGRAAVLRDHTWKAVVRRIFEMAGFSAPELSTVVEGEA